MDVTLISHPPSPDRLVCARALHEDGRVDLTNYDGPITDDETYSEIVDSVEINDEYRPEKRFEADGTYDPPCNRFYNNGMLVTRERAQLECKTISVIREQFEKGIFETFSPTFVFAVHDTHEQSIVKYTLLEYVCKEGSDSLPPGGKSLVRETAPLTFEVYDECGPLHEQ